MDIGLLTTEQESRFNKLIESPLTKFRSEVEANPLYQPNWEQFRAGALYFFGQTKRFNELQGVRDNEETLQNFLDRHNDYLDGLARAWQQRYQLVQIRTIEGQQLFFPQIGYFIFKFRDTRAFYGYQVGFAVPMTPEWCLAMIPIESDKSELDAQRNILMAFSKGINDNTKRVVIPPEIYKLNSPEAIAAHVRESRKKAISHAENFLKMKDAVTKMYEIAGITITDAISSWNLKL